LCLLANDNVHGRIKASRGPGPKYFVGSITQKPGDTQDLAPRPRECVTPRLDSQDLVPKTS